GLVGRFSDTPQRRAFDLFGLRGLRALVPVRADAFGQRDARRNGIDVDALRAELVSQLAGESDDAPLRGGIGTRTVPAQSAPGNRSEIDDLAAAPPLHYRDHRMGEQEGAVEVEGDELLP